MSRLLSILFLAILLLSLSACILGGTLVYRASKLPAVSDQRALADLRSISPPSRDSADSKLAYERFKTEWFDARDALLTPKWPMFDRGLSLLSLGLSCIGGMVVFRAMGIRRIPDVRTPKRKIIFLSLAPAVLFLCVVASFSRWGELQLRGLDPSWGDSPVAEMLVAILAVVVAPFILLACWLAIRKSVLPVNLWVWNTSHIWRSAVWTFISGLLGLLVLISMVHDAWSGSYRMMPLGLVWLYLILSVRAVLVERGSTRL